MTTPAYAAALYDVTISYDDMSTSRHEGLAAVDLEALVSTFVVLPIRGALIQRQID